MGRVYLPQEELAQFGLCDKDVYSRKVSDRWREFMKQQITRARLYFDMAEEGASQLDKASRWPVRSPNQSEKQQHQPVILEILFEISTSWGMMSFQVWSSLMLYRKILDAIEENDYDNLTKRAYVGRTKKLLTLPLAYTRAFAA